MEALAVLVALRIWKRVWSLGRATIRVATDNMAALATVCRMSAKSHSLSVVARELALDIADALYDPVVAEHIPGVANVTAAALSRRFDPRHKYEVPQILRNASEVRPPRRDDKW